MTSKDPNSTSKAPPGDLMAAAEELVAKVEAVYCNKGVEKAVAQNDGLMMDAKNSALRWFVLPSEAVLLMNKEQVPGAKVTLVTCARASSPSSPSSPSAEQRSGSSSSSSGAMDVDVKTQQTTAPEATAASNKKKMEADDNVCGNCFHVHRPLDASSSSSSSVSSSAASHASSVECVSCECTTFQPQSMLAATKANKKKLTKVFNRLVGRAVFDFDMIREGDRILVGVSGGKDSLTLVHVLRALQRKSPVKFDIGCVTVDPMTPEYDPSSLIEYFAGLGIPYFYEKQGILDAAKACLLGIGQSPCGPEGCSVEDDNADVAESKAKKNRVSLCAYCARMKRGVLYSTCKREGYNVLALGQHLDDLAESFLMSAFHNGLLRTMKAHYAAADHDLRIIRPLVYVRESLTRQFSSVFELPIINENCPACFEAPKERARMKKVLASQEQIHPQLYLSLQKTMMPLMAIPTAHSTTLDLSFDPKKTAQSKKEQQRKAINERKALRGGRNPKANGKRPAADPPSSSSSSSGDSSHKRAKKQ
jgi:tRNA 2-thiocytidine biosynthesis protein TtcA